MDSSAGQHWARSIYACGLASGATSTPAWRWGQVCEVIHWAHSAIAGTRETLPLKFPPQNPVFPTRCHALPTLRRASRGALMKSCGGKTPGKQWREKLWREKLRRETREQQGDNVALSRPPRASSHGRTSLPGGPSTGQHRLLRKWCRPFRCFLQRCSHCCRNGFFCTNGRLQRCGHCCKKGFPQQQQVPAQSHNSSLNLCVSTYVWTVFSSVRTPPFHDARTQKHVRVL